jgi:hypothetical protein
MTLLLTCKRCKGTGVVPNEHFEICKALRSEETKRHFHVHAQTEELEAENDNAGWEAICGEPPTVSCPQCDGEGVLEFDEDEWDLLVVPDEGEETGGEE